MHNNVRVDMTDAAMERMADLVVERLLERGLIPPIDEDSISVGQRVTILPKAALVLVDARKSRYSPASLRSSTNSPDIALAWSVVSA